MLIYNSRDQIMSSGVSHHPAHRRPTLRRGIACALSHRRWPRRSLYTVGKRRGPRAAVAASLYAAMRRNQELALLDEPLPISARPASIGPSVRSAAAVRQPGAVERTVLPSGRGRVERVWCEHYRGLTGRERGHGAVDRHPFPHAHGPMRFWCQTRRMAPSNVPMSRTCYAWGILTLARRRPASATTVCEHWITGDASGRNRRPCTSSIYL